MKLRSNIKGKTKVGYLVSADRSGRFVYARAGDVPIGVITESVTRGELCEIQTTGEALVYVGKSIKYNEVVRSPDTDEGVPAGSALPVGGKTLYINVGQALESGKGLIRVSINLSATSSSSSSLIPTGGVTGAALVKASAADYDLAWQTVGAGTVTSVAAGNGMDFTTITGAGTVAMGTPSTITATSTNGFAGSNHSHELDESTLGFTVTVDGSAPTPNTISIGGALDFLGDTTYIQIQWNQTNQQLEFSYVGPTDFYEGWDPGTDTGTGHTRVGSAHNVNIIGGTYLTTAYLFTSGTFTHDITVDIDQVAFNAAYYTQTAADALFATQTYVNSNFDNYASWALHTGGILRETITSGFALDVIGDTTYIQVQYNTTDDRLEFSYVGPTDFYEGWDPGTDTGTGHTRVGSAHDVNIVGGTYLTTAYAFATSVHTITVDIDQVAFNAAYYTQTAADALFATQTWVTNNFDNYSAWAFEYDPVTPQEKDINSGDSFGIVGGTDIGTSWDGVNNRLTINYAGTASYTGWDLKVDAAAAVSIGNGEEVVFTAGTNVTLDWTPGAGTNDITINSTDQYVGTVTAVTGGTGIGSTGGTTPDISLDLSELTVATMVTGDWIAFDNAGASNKALISTIPLSIFNNDSGWTTNTGTVTNVLGGVGLTAAGTTSITLTLAVDELAEKTGGLVGTDRLVGTSGTTNFAETISAIPLSIFNNDSGWASGTGDMDSWTFYVDSDAGHSISNLGSIDLVAGTGIAIAYSLNVSTHTATISSTVTQGVTSVTGGNGIDSSGGLAPDISLNIDELSAGGVLVGTDHLAAANSTASNKQLISSIPLSIFNNDSGWTSNAGTVTLVGGGTGLSGTVSTSGNINLDLNSLTAGGVLVGTDHLAAANGTVSNKQLISSIPLSIFSNDSGWTSNVGTVTSVTGGTGIDSTGGATPSIAFNGSELGLGGTLIATDHLVAVNGGVSNRQLISSIPLSIFNNDSGWTAGGGSMDNWFINTDHVDSRKSISEDAEVYFIGGTGIDLTEVTWNSSDLRWEMTIASTTSGTVTSVATGTGLTGGTITTSGTVSAASKAIPLTSLILGGSINLNDYDTQAEAGFYYQNSNANAVSGSNYPVDLAGSLTVLKDAGVNQMYHTYGSTNDLYIRTYYSAAWTSWKKLGTVESVGNGSGMNFTTITGTGTVTLGTPSTLTSATTNAVTTSSHTHAITTGIAANNIVKVAVASVDNDYAKFTSTGLEGRTYAEVAADIDASTFNFSASNNVTGGNFQFYDNVEIEMGTGNDVSIYFSGSHLYFDTISVATDIYFRGITTTKFLFDIGSGYGTAADWYATSDIRAKENIQPFHVDMDKFVYLGHKAIRHNWKEGFGPANTPEIGFIAQDVEEFYPELVTIGKETPHFRALSYGKLTTVAIKATAQTWEYATRIKSEVDELKEKVRNLEDELNTLKNG